MPEVPSCPLEVESVSNKISKISRRFQKFIIFKRNYIIILYKLYKFKIFTFARYQILQFLLSTRGYKLFILIIESRDFYLIKISRPYRFVFLKMLVIIFVFLFHHSADLKDIQYMRTVYATTQINLKKKKTQAESIFFQERKAARVSWDR